MWKNFRREINIIYCDFPLSIFLFYHLEHIHDKFYRSTVNESSTIASFRLRTSFVKRKDGISPQHFRTYFSPRVVQREKKEEKGVKYRVPSVPLALSSLRDRAAPVDSTYSRISPRFWYDGVSRDLCKMVRSSLGSFSARSTLYLTRAQPWRAGGPFGATPRFLFRGLRSSGGRSQGRRGPSYLTDAFPMYSSSERASEWRNERSLLPIQMFRNSFILRNSCSKSDNVAARRNGCLD